MSLRDEIKNDIARRYVEDVNQEMNLLADHIFSKIKKRIDKMINDVNQEFKNEGYEGIKDIWMNLDVDDIVDYKELQAEKRVLEEVKELLK
ncbi:MAG: hypothetical protein K0S93_83 [Nitrososphaeraceae archaeon]|jgi:protein gp37|nr:hypothetical protein [Nitrososphaeraceae archaeon]